MTASGADQGLPAMARVAETQAAQAAAIAVTVQGASKTYPNGVHALAAIDLQVREREFATLLGPSGCGKSTLLRMIGGLSQPTAGSVALWPGNTQHLSRQRLAFVFQSPTLMPWASVEHNVRLPLDLASAVESVEAKVRSALELVGLQEFRGVFPRELSGGMQMRASIARALVTEPRLLLMDEPFGALDEITRNRLDREIRDLWARRSLSVVFVTHSIYEAVFLSTRVLVMSARPGRIVGELVIDEPHPRTDALRVSERFARWCAQLSDMLAAASDEATGA
jgi:NitT/TauT family transport system ATP-binding protein